MLEVLIGFLKCRLIYWNTGNRVNRLIIQSGGQDLVSFPALLKCSFA